MMLTPVRMLSLLVAILSAVLASMWLDPQGHRVNTSWAAPAAKAPDLKAPGPLPIGSSGPTDASGYASVLERPLFAPDRRPLPVVQSAQADPFADIQVYGVLTGTIAGIMARIDGKVRQVRIGETVGAWTLKSIADRSITFTQGDQTRQLQLAYAKLNTVSPQPPRIAQALTAAPLADRFQLDAAAAYRENLRKRNEVRAARGVPLITE
jgi:hypothetical protein